MSWKSHFIRTLSRYIPTKVCKVKKSLPWMSPDLFKLFRKCDIAFSKYKATKSECHLSRYRTFRNKSLGALRKAKCEFFKRLSTLIRSPKQFWSLYYSLTPNRQRIPATLNDGTVTVESATSKATLLASHFSACFLNPLTTSTVSVILSPLSSVTCTTDEVHKLPCSLKTKTASGPDGLSVTCFATQPLLLHLL